MSGSIRNIFQAASLPTDMTPGRIEKASAEDELGRRRERGRRSQAAFRKRQAQAAQALSEQSRRLLEGVQRAVDLVRGDERQDMLTALANLAALAGLDAKENRSEDAIVHPGDEDITVGAANRNFTRKTKSSAGTCIQSHDMAAQRLDCGIWLDPLHYGRVSLPPQDIIPYLGPGWQTFAGQLFWSVMDHSLNSCRHPHAEASAVVKAGLGHSTATQDVKISFIRSMVEARLEFKTTGSVSLENAAAGESDLGMVLRNQVETDYRARGKDPDLWLSCVAIEQRVKGIAGNSAFLILERAAQGDGDPNLQEVLRHIKCRLSDTAVCFGDGPRWNVGVVDSLFLDPVIQAAGGSKEMTICTNASLS